MQLTYTQLSKHRLADWQVRLDHAKQRCGLCNYSAQIISLSRHFIEANDEVEILNTILHEIAHALVGPGHAHGVKWQKVAARIGARTAPTAGESTVMPQPGWGLHCRDCSSLVAMRFRRCLDLSRVRCRQCNPQGGVQHGKVYWQKL
ncbi:MAG: transcription elongation protein SprT [Gammaproteobacteria bacterium]|nr:transcription elongation protein SprT [Gammaproteobacteria bacterium]